MRQNQKPGLDNFPWKLAGGLGAIMIAGAVYFLWPARGQPQASQEQRQAVAPHAHRRVQLSQRYPLGIDIVGPAIDDRVQGIGVVIPRAAHQELAQYLPVWYEISGLNRLRTTIPIEQFKDRAYTRFTSPLSIDGRTLTLYGIDPETRETVILEEMLLRSTGGQRQYH